MKEQPQDKKPSPEKRRGSYHDKGEKRHRSEADRNRENARDWPTERSPSRQAYLEYDPRPRSWGKRDSGSYEREDQRETKRLKPDFHKPAPARFSEAAAQPRSISRAGKQEEAIGPSRYPRGSRPETGYTQAFQAKQELNRQIKQIFSGYPTAHRLQALQALLHQHSQQVDAVHVSQIFTKLMSHTGKTSQEKALKAASHELIQDNVMRLEALLRYQPPLQARTSATLLHRFGDFAQHDLLKGMPQLKAILPTLLDQLASATPAADPQGIAMALSGLGKCAEARLLTGMTFSAERIHALLRQLASAQPPANTQAIGMVLSGLGKCAEAGWLTGMTFSAEIIHALLGQLASAQPETQHIGMVLSGLGKCAEAGVLAGLTFPAEIIHALLEQLASAKPPTNTQAIGMVLSGLGKCAEARLLTGVTFPAEIIHALLEQLASAQPPTDTQAIGMVLSGLGKCAEAGVLTGLTFPAEIIRALLGQLASAKPPTDTQAIGMVLSGLGKCAEAGVLTGVTFPAEIIHALLGQLASAQPETQYIGMVLGGLSKCAEVGLLTGMTFPAEIIHALLEQLASAKPEMQHIGMVLSGLGKCAETGLLAGLTFPAEIIYALLEQLASAKPPTNTQAIGMVLSGLGKCAEARLLTGVTFPAEIIHKLLEQLVGAKPAAKLQEIAMALSGLGKCAEARLLTGMTFPAEIIHKLLGQLVGAKPAAKLQEIAMALSGLGKCAEAGMLTGVTFPAEIIQALLEQLASAKPETQHIGMALSGLGVCMEYKVLPLLDLATLQQVKSLLTRLKARPFAHQASGRSYSIITSLIGWAKLLSGHSSPIKDALLEDFAHTLNGLLARVLANKLNANVRVLAVDALSRLLQLSHPSLHFAVFKPDFLKLLPPLSTHWPNAKHQPILVSALARLAVADRQALLTDAGVQESFTRLYQLQQQVSRYTGQPLAEHWQTVDRWLQAIATRAPLAAEINANVIVEEKPAQLPEDMTLAFAGQAIAPRLQLRAQDAPRHYSVQNPQDIQALEQVCQIRYKPNKQREDAINIGPVAALGGAYGAFAAKDLALPNKKKSLSLGTYQGKRVVLDEEAASEYAFELERPGAAALEEDSPLEVIDAIEERNWTGFVNHREEPSLQVKCMTKQSQPAIFFLLTEPVKAGDQLFINYGPHFFRYLKTAIKPRYLHRSDDWRLPDTVYQQGMKEYQPTFLRLAPSLAHALGFTQGPLVVATHLWAAVLSGDQSAVAVALAETSHPEQLSYSVEPRAEGQARLAELAHQPQVTPLMLACYLGQGATLQQLLAAGADINRRALHTGDTPLFFLLRGQGSAEVKREMTKYLLQQGAYVTLANAQQQTVLNEALCLQDVGVVQLLLQTDTRVGQDLVERLFAQPDDPFTTLVLQGQTELMALVVQAAQRQHLLEVFAQEDISLHALILQAPLTTLQRLLSLLRERGLLKERSLVQQISQWLRERRMVLATQGTADEQKQAVELHQQWVEAFQFPRKLPPGLLQQLQADVELPHASVPSGIAMPTPPASPLRSAYASHGFFPTATLSMPDSNELPPECWSGLDLNEVPPECWSDLDLNEMPESSKEEMSFHPRVS